ncbi:MAG: hypothetical protein ACRDMV_02750 [Streptosporangiales bacterium]
MQALGVWLWVIVAAVVILVVGIILYATSRVHANRRTAMLREHFGAEYDRVVAEHGRPRGEAELRERLRRRREVTVRNLDAAERDRFGSAWESAQSAFVDKPVQGLREADLLVMQVMRERGYPVEHFEERADLISVDHPDLVEHFRSAHAAAVANEQEPVETEDLRQAMVDYRYLFDELLQGGDIERIPRV